MINYVQNIQLAMIRDASSSLDRPGRAPTNTADSWGPEWLPQFSSHFWVMVFFALVVGFKFNFTKWGNHLFAIGGNEQVARLTGVPTKRIKFQAYLFSAFTASVASLLILGYSGSAINALGQTYELRVIAAPVIGSANLMSGAGTAFGAVVGSALLEVIRNALLMAGIDSNWIDPNRVIRKRLSRRSHSGGGSEDGCCRGIYQTDMSGTDIRKLTRRE